MAVSPNPHCEFCFASGAKCKLYRCQACNIVYYCGREHQTAHRGDHKRNCDKVKKALKIVSSQERKLRSLPSGPQTPGNLFEEQAGRFWEIPETRDFVVARFQLVGALSNIKTYAAVKAAHEHSSDLLRLDRNDQVDIHLAIPAFYLRLGKHQDCYDFCLWWLSKARDEDFKPRDLDLPNPSVKNADVLKLNDRLLFGSELCHTIAITLLKVELYLDISTLSKSFVLAEKVPKEILNAIQEQMLSGTAIAGRNNTVDRSNHASVVRKLRKQIKAFYKEVNTRNHRFWPAMLSCLTAPDPGRAFLTINAYRAGPRQAAQVYVGPGSVEEMQIAIRFSIDAWNEVPGAFDVVRKISEVYLKKDTMEAVREGRWSL